MTNSTGYIIKHIKYYYTHTNTEMWYIQVLVQKVFYFVWVTLQHSKYLTMYSVCKIHGTILGACSLNTHTTENACVILGLQRLNYLVMVSFNWEGVG